MRLCYRARVNAKINLSLTITGKRGYMHELDTIMYPIQLADAVKFTPYEGSAELIYKQGIFADNKTVRVSVTSRIAGFDKQKFLEGAGEKIKAVAARLGLSGEVKVYKHIPAGAGLGGSSAAVAAAIKAMCDFCEEHGKSAYLDSDFLLSLGSDLTYFIHGGICKVQGIGEIVIPLEVSPKLWFAALIPHNGVDSGRAYEMYDDLRQKYPEKYMDEHFMLPPRDVSEAIFVLRNDLYESAALLNGDVTEAYDILKSAGAKKIIMSGSGSCVVAICESAEEARYVLKKCKFNGSKQVFEGC